jgi:hypothetical protein
MSEVEGNRLIYGDEEYYAIKNRLSPSGLKFLDDCPKSYSIYEKSGVEVTQAMETGKLIHSLLLEPHTVKKLYTFLPQKLLPFPDKDFKTKANRDFREQFIIDNSDKTVFANEDDFWNIVNLTKEVHKNKTAKKLLSKATVELGMCWTDFVTDVPMRGKSDGFYSAKGKERSYILDVKKMPNISPDKVRRLLVERFIPSQVGVYASGLQEFGYKPMDDYYIFAIQEKPANFAIYKINQFIEDGLSEFYRLANLYKKCKAEDNWPGYEMYGDEAGIIDLTSFTKREQII